MSARARIVLNRLRITDVAGLCGADSYGNDGCSAIESYTDNTTYCRSVQYVEENCFSYLRTMNNIVHVISRISTESILRALAVIVHTVTSASLNAKSSCMTFPLFKRNSKI